MQSDNTSPIAPFWKDTLGETLIKNGRKGKGNVGLTLFKKIFSSPSRPQLWLISELSKRNSTMERFRKGTKDVKAVEG